MMSSNLTDLGQRGWLRGKCVRRVLQGVAGLCLAVVTAPIQAAPIMIDDFITAQSIFATAATPIATASATAPETIGGERDIKLQYLSGSTAISVSTNPFGTGLFIHDSGSAVKGSSLTVWDGKDSNGNVIDYDGLGGANLVAGGLNAFEMKDVLADLVGDLILTVYDASDIAGNKWSRATLNLPGGMFAPTDILMPYASFVTVGPGGAASFANVGAISMEVKNATTGSLDVEMSSIQAVPEPATGLLALGGLSLLTLGTRRRWK